MGSPAPGPVPVEGGTGLSSSVVEAPGTDVQFTIWRGVPPPPAIHEAQILYARKIRRVLAVQETYKDA